MNDGQCSTYDDHAELDPRLVNGPCGDTLLDDVEIGDDQ